MGWFRSRPQKAHRVVVYHVDEDSFLAECECGWSSSLHRIWPDALRDAYSHDAHVLPEIQEMYGGGIYPWQCLFCGAVVEGSPENPVRVRLNWMEVDGEEERRRELWCGAHRECLIQHASKDFTRTRPHLNV
jgi:hypothetical protein